MLYPIILRTLLKALAFVLLVAPLHAQVDPSIDWKRIRTEHFELIYDARQQSLANTYARRLEKVYQTLAPHWVMMPPKTITILNDRTDFTNGYATALPYPHMMLFPVLPGPSESIGEYGDWAEELLLHEYTHVLSFEQRRGIPWALSGVFGSIMTPNILMSRWSLEGIAVDAETRHSRHGRLRSQYQEATLRSLVRDGRWNEFRYGEMNESSIPDWPYGARPYLFGSLMWSEMLAKHGTKLAKELHYEMGGRAPYTFGGLVEGTTGRSLETWFTFMRGTVDAETRRQVAEMKPLALTLTGPAEGDGPKSAAVELLSPVLSPDGLKLAFFAKGEDLRRSVQIWIRPSVNVAFSSTHAQRKVGVEEDENMPGGDPKIPRLRSNHTGDDNPAGASIQRVSWLPDSKGFVFDQIADVSPFREVGDLWLHELKASKSTQLSKGLRAREPDVSPDGKQVAYTQIEAGKTGLGIFDLATKKAVTVWSGREQDRVSYPVWLDSRRVLFSLRRDGRDRFAIWEEGRELVWPLPDFPNARFAVKSGDSILFTSTKNGVQNLYRADLALTHARPLTHSASAVYLAAEDRQRGEFFLTEIGPRGFEIRRAPAGALVPENAQLPLVAPLLHERYPVPQTEEGESVESTEQTAELASEEYTVGRYLFPRYWVPFIYWDDISTKATVFTGGQDPLAKHAYSIAGAYDTRFKTWGGSFSYENHVLYPTLAATYYDLYAPVAVTLDYQRNQGASLMSKWEFAFGSPDWALLFGFMGTQRTVTGFTAKQWGPTVGVGYSNVSQTAAQISPESGRSGALTYTAFQKGTDLQAYNLASGNFTNYFSRWLPKRHVFYSRFQAQYTDQAIPIANFESSSSSAPFQIGPSVYLMRGYLPGQFLGRTMLNTNLEYRMPLKGIYRESVGTIFLQRVYGAVVADGLWGPHFVYDTKADAANPPRTPSPRWKAYWDAGVEARMEFSIGYHFPMSLVSGVYWPLDTEYATGGPRFAFGLSL